MLNQYEKAAYQGKPPPDDLSTGLLACGYGSMQAAGCPEAIEMKGFWQAAHKEKLQQNQSISRMESEKENLSLFYQKTVNFPSTLSKTLAMKNDL